MESKLWVKILLTMGESCIQLVPYFRLKINYILQWFEVRLSRLSQLEKEFKGVGYFATSWPKHDSKAAFLCFIRTSGFEMIFNLTVLFNNFLCLGLVFINHRRNHKFTNRKGPT